MAVSTDYLLTIATWAHELTPAEAEQAARGITEKTVPKGGYLCHRGDRMDSWTGIVSGLLKLSAVSSLGKPVTFSGLAAGGWFGEGTVIKDELRQYDIMALRESRIASLNGATFRRLFETSTGFNRFLVRQLNERLGQFIGMVAHQRMLDSTGQVARNIAWLLNPVLFPAAGNKIEISQEEIGLLAAVSRQATNRCLKLLEEKGYLKVLPDGIRVLDREALMHYGE